MFHLDNVNNESKNKMHEENLFTWIHLVFSFAWLVLDTRVLPKKMPPIKGSCL